MSKEHEAKKENGYFEEFEFEIKCDWISCEREKAEGNEL